MTMAYPTQLLELAATVEGCGHLVSRRHVDSGGRERCVECERERKREYEGRRGPRSRRGGQPGVVEYPATLKSRVHLRVVEEALPQRPSCRAECADVPRPCPFVSCRYSLYLDVTRSGALRLNFPQIEPGDMPPDASCALDVAERGGLWHERVGAALNVTRERVLQIEASALEKLQPRAAALREHLDEE